MTNYRGYYIDNVIFNSEEEIDNFIKAQAIETYRRAVILFSTDCTLANSVYCDEKAQILVDKYGYTWEEIEQLEISTLESVA